MDIYLDRIKPLFVSSGKTDAEIEREIGIPPKTINKWNSGLKSYRKYIAQIAKYFGVDADYLLGYTDEPRPRQEIAGKEQKNSPSSEDGDGLSDMERKVLKLFHQFPEEEWDNILLAVEVALRSKGLLR